MKVHNKQHVAKATQTPSTKNANSATPSNDVKPGWMPSPTNLADVYRQEAQSAFSKHVAPLKKQPIPESQLKNLQPIDITPPREMGVKQEVYLFKGQAYLRDSALTNPPKATWYHIGAERYFE